jgi:hypothetical protein
MRIKEVILIALILALLLVVNVSSLYTEDNNPVSFGHPLRVQNVSVPDLAPGQAGILKISLKNNAAYIITDVRAKLMLPTQLQFLNDVNEVRIAELEPNETKDVLYSIISLPTSSEGIYSASLLINYVSHYGVNTFNVGEDNADNYSFGVIIKSQPSLFVQLDTVDVYKEKLTGDITLKFVNNGTSNIKFLTVNLGPTDDYTLLSDSKYYVGDLDSNDYQSVVYKLKVNKKVSDINLPIDITYRDSMSNVYSQKLSTNLKIVDGSELGKTSDISTTAIIIIIIIIIVIVYFVYSRIKNKRKIKKL